MKDLKGWPKKKTKQKNIEKNNMKLQQRVNKKIQTTDINPWRGDSISPHLGSNKVAAVEH